jgi:hypothetical protein
MWQSTQKTESGPTEIKGMKAIEEYIFAFQTGKSKSLIGSIIITAAGALFAYFRKCSQCYVSQMPTF